MATFGRTTKDSRKGQEPLRAAFREETLREEVARCSSVCGKAGRGGGEEGDRDELRRSRGLEPRKLPAQLSSWAVPPGTRPGAFALDTRSAPHLHPLLAGKSTPAARFRQGKARPGTRGGVGLAGWTSLMGQFLLRPAWPLREGGSAWGCYGAPAASRITSYQLHSNLAWPDSGVCQHANSQPTVKSKCKSWFHSWLQLLKDK